MLKPGPQDDIITSGRALADPFMTDLNYRLLHTVSSAAKLGDAVTRLLEIAAEHTGATACACMRGAPSSHFFLIVAAKDGTLRPPHKSSAMIKLEPEHAASTEISEVPEGLIFAGTACFANVSCKGGFLVRLEWDDLVKVNWDQVTEIRAACAELGTVLHRYEQIDSRISPLPIPKSQVEVSAQLEKDLDDHRLERLLPRLVRLIVARSPADAACVFAAHEEGKFVLEPKAYVGDPSIDMGRLPLTWKMPEKSEDQEPVYVRAALTGEPVLVPDLKKSKVTLPLLSDQKSAIAVPVAAAGETIGVLVASSSASGAFSEEHLDPLVRLGREIRQPLWKAILYMRTVKTTPTSPLLLVGQPREMLDAAERYASSRAPLLLTGETGTGKESLARFIHMTSDRRHGPFVPVNAAEITETLAESQLFGHRKGAFTGAVRDMPGAFETAHGGTLFLDEIDHLNITAQAKVLRAIEYGEIRPLGAREGRKVDVRIIVATNKDLAALVREERFLQDLFLRINVLRLRLPPLRENRDAISRIARTITEELCTRDDRKVPNFTPRSLKMLKKYEFPGNIRELRNIVQNALVSPRQSIIDAEAFPEHIMKRSSEPAVGEIELGYEKARTRFERDYLVRLVRHTKGNMTEAAGIAGLDRSHLYRMLKKHGLKPNDILQP